MTKFLFPFLISFGISSLLLFPTVYFSKKFAFLKSSRSPEGRHVHKDGIPRTGGLIMVLAFNLAIFFNPNLFISTELYGFLAGTIILLAIGLRDDFKEITWKIQLFIQVAVSVFIFIMGVRIYYITNPIGEGLIDLGGSFGVIFSVILVIFWILLVINAINWSDGVDGLSGGITLITAGTIFLLTFRPEVNQPPVAIISAALLGAVLGFLLFNFYPSKIIAGTAGSTFMGFSLAVLAIFSGTKIATALLVLAIPIADFLWVIGERISEGRSIFIADKNHLHHKLMKLGWTQRKIFFAYFLFTLAVSSISLSTQSWSKLVAIISTGVLVLGAIVLVNRKISILRKK